MMKRRLILLLAAATSLVPSSACFHIDDDDDAAPAAGPASAVASSFTADVAVAWGDQLNDNFRVAAFSPPVASRAAGYAGVTGYECVVPGMLDHQSLGGQLNQLAALPPIGTEEYHWPLVLNAGQAQIQRALFATAPQPVLDAINALEADIADDFPTVAQTVIDRSIARGVEVADAIALWATTDGFTTFNNCAYTPPPSNGDDGLWVPTPPANAAALQPCWGQLRPFVLLFGAECSVLGPPVYSEVAGSKFHQEALEVRDTVDNLTPEQIDIAQFWADNPGATGTPVGHWISIVSQVSVQQSLTLDLAVEAYARVGMATADSFIACWDTKFIYNLLRPITYIRQSPGPIDDPTWNTAPNVSGLAPANIPTPPFPEYTSGHSTQSAAVAFVLTDLLGTVAFDDDTHAALGTPPLAPRSFASFDEAADEAAISRLYGGIHYRSAIERGVQQGTCIGDTIVDEIDFLK